MNTGSPHRPQQDLAVMSFGDHLEELRVRVLRVILVLLGGAAIGLLFQTHLMTWVTGPHRVAMTEIGLRAESRQHSKVLIQISERLQNLDSTQLRSEYGRMNYNQRKIEQLDRIIFQKALLGEGVDVELMVWLKELNFANGRLQSQLWPLAVIEERARAVGEIWESNKDSFPSGVYEASEDANADLKSALDYLISNKTTAEALAGTNPQLMDQASIEKSVLDREALALEEELSRLQRMIDENVQPRPLTVLKYTDSFFAHLKLCFLFGFLLAMPWLSFEIWSFVAAGLYKTERASIRPFIPFSFVFLVGGSCFAYYVLVPVGLGYLGSYGSGELISTAFTLRDYISLLVTMLIGMALVFQLPLVMVFLSKAGMMEVETFITYRKYSILAGVIVGAMLTPPDVVTQLLMAGPLIFLYQCGIWASLFFRRRARKAAR